MRANDSNAEKDKNNPYAPEYIGVEKFLDIISLEPTSSKDGEQFCLSHVFTYRDFEDGVLGLAWVAEPGKMVVLFLFLLHCLSKQPLHALQKGMANYIRHKTIEICIILKEEGSGMLNG